MRNRFDVEVRRAVTSLPVRQLAADGVSSKQLRGPAWRRTSFGNYAPLRPGHDMGPTQRILDMAPLIPPSGALAGWAAAWVHGVASADGLHPHTVVPLPVVIALGASTGRGQHAGAAYSRERLPQSDVTRRAGLPVTTVRRTAFDLARWSENLVEAVVAVDAILQAELSDIEQLREYVRQHPRWKGVPLARAALDLASTDVRSPWESRLRYTCEVEAGLPRLLVNQPIVGLDGRLLAIVDLFDEESALAIEFDGQQHRERDQHAADNVREELLESVGLTVVRADSVGWRRDRSGLVHRLQDGRRRGLRRNRSLDRWRLGPEQRRHARSG